MRENAQDIEGRTLLIIHTHNNEQTAARKWWVFPSNLNITQKHLLSWLCSFYIFQR